MQATTVRRSIDLELPPAKRIPGLAVRTITAVSYVRQSPEELRQGKRGIDEQAARIRSFVESRGWDFLATYQDIARPGDDLQRPGLLELLAHPDFEVLLVDTADRLACKKKDLDFLMALLEKLGVTCVAATWSWDYLAQYMRHCYRTRGNSLYALLDETDS